MLQNYVDSDKNSFFRNWLDGRCFEDGMTMTTDTALLNIRVRGFVWNCGLNIAWPTAADIYIFDKYGNFWTSKYILRSDDGNN